VFDAPVDAWYVWLGLSVASVALIGVGTALPTAPPPPATDAADTIDRIAATTYPSMARSPIDARSIHLTPRTVGLRNDAGVTHAAFSFGPITPVLGSPALRAVLRGAPPPSRFDSGDKLCATAATARDRPSRWRDLDDPLVVRHVIWEGCDVTVVG
jgi:hypothetical protein